MGMSSNRWTSIDLIFKMNIKSWLLLEIIFFPMCTSTLTVHIGATLYMYCSYLYTSLTLYAFCGKGA